MKREMTVRLPVASKTKNPPAWAVGDQTSHHVWYYENDLGETWVAKSEGDRLLISGFDLGWEEFALSVEQAKAEKERLGLLVAASELAAVHPKLAQILVESATIRSLSTQNCPLGKVVLDLGEQLWVLSVINAALPRMEVRRDN
ncbi:hypothetical protein J2Z79_002492 [Symbiobacterium terraclitae]|uniref:Uncharacterized protein n=1 Tax=Symbiobacterium terraclitae TaxID=557451 RepID=A0ABS4JU71_9FIRM|nr:hypothetical protein [Symbiobacterium terraclitae]MBP2019075.1 hypothetical protein [Symbiobacterium terraclitae]